MISTHINIWAKNQHTGGSHGTLKIFHTLIGGNLVRIKFYILASIEGMVNLQ